MEFEWSPEEARFREALRAFLDRELPDDWDAISRDGPGSDAQLDFSRDFCRRLAAAGWLTPTGPPRGAAATPRPGATPCWARRCGRAASRAAPST